MKKLLLFLVAFVCMSNSDCDSHSHQKEQVYLVIEKGSSVGSHFNPFHRDNFSVGTDYYVTLQNVTTKHTFVHKCFDAKEYYLYQKGKKYRCTRFREDSRY